MAIKFIQIVITPECKAKLLKLKIHPREGFGSVIEKLLQEHEESLEKEIRMINEYDVSLDKKKRLLLPQEPKVEEPKNPTPNIQNQ